MMIKIGEKVKFSIIIPFREPSEHLYECLDHIRVQSYKNYEVILLPDNSSVMLNSFQHPKKIPKQVRDDDRHAYQKIKVIPTGHMGPAEKRDIGVNTATGEILAFIDDDAYPDSHWLENARKNFADPQIAAVGGPGVTPPNSSWAETISGWFSASPLGGGSYTYRFLPQVRQFVDDYPSMNLAVRKSDFMKVGGFDSNFWPGEDTKLCLDLTHKLGKKIIYDPQVLVYHHRRPVWMPHFAQNGNYGLHRGYFARILPRTSFRPVYFLPSFLVLGLILLPLAVVPVYGLLLVANGLWVMVKSRSLFLGLISMPVVFLTHFWYGVRFIQGFLFTKQLRR